MAVGFPAISLLLLYLIRARSAEGSLSTAALVLAGGFSLAGVVAGLLALYSPRLGRKLYIAWMTMTLPVGLLMSTLLLTILYFLLLPVFSLIVRRKDPLRKKLGGPTYWEDYKPHEPTIERMRRPF